MHQAIYEELKRAARARKLPAYSEIAPLAGLDMSNPADRNEISAILGEISTYEHEQGRPLLSAIVVLADSHMPGPGFFTLASELGLYSGHSEFAAMEFFVEEVKRVYAAWS